MGAFTHRFCHKIFEIETASFILSFFITFYRISGFDYNFKSQWPLRKKWTS